MADSWPARNKEGTRERGGVGRRGQNTRKRHERSITMRYLTCQLSRARIFSYSSSEQQGNTPSTNRKSLSVPIEDPETTETTLARADARLPSSSMRAHIHIHTLSLSLFVFSSFVSPSPRAHGACASRWNGADALSSCSLVDPCSLIHAFRHAREPRSVLPFDVPTIVSPA